MLSAELNQLAWDISRLLPKKDRSDEGVRCACPRCKMTYCKNAHADDENCKTCYWGSRNACGKLVKKIKICQQCERSENEKSTRSEAVSCL